MGPAQLFHQPTDVVAVVSDVELVLDQSADARRGPQIGGVTVRLGAFQKEPDESLVLGGCQPRRPSRRGANLQRFGAATAAHVAPAHDATGCAVDKAGNIIKGTPFVQQSQGAVPAVLQKVRRSFGSHVEGPP